MVLLRSPLSPYCLSLFFTLSTVVLASDPNCVFPGTCEPPSSDDYKFSAGVPALPRVQWPDSGGFCGSVSIQAIALSKGAYISQDLVRKNAPEGGGHGDPEEGYEILHTNIEAALTNLAIKYEAWDWENEPRPQGEAYLGWLKTQLTSGSGVVQFVLCQGDRHNAYGNRTHPIPYDHIEPIFGIFSKSPLAIGAPLFDDDVVVHGSDYAPDGAKNSGYFRTLGSLLDDVKMQGNCKDAQAGYGKNEMFPCINEDVTYGYALSGLDRRMEAGEISVRVTVPSISEPDVRENEAPVEFVATVALDGELADGVEYCLYRWSDVRRFPREGALEDSAFDDRFRIGIDVSCGVDGGGGWGGEGGGGEECEIVDPKPFLSNSMMYYAAGVCDHARELQWS